MNSYSKKIINQDKQHSTDKYETRNEIILYFCTLSVCQATL